jgi:KaiC/GvpD/RAD55 family RecA-like ATPase
MGSRPSSFVLTQDGPLRLYSTLELLKLPPPTWQIEGAIPAGGLVAIYGPPGVGKSFVTIDLALSIATGRDWFGRQVERGSVVYISAEGGAGISKRVRAWLTAHDVDPREADVSWMLEPMMVDADSDDMTRLIDRIVGEARRDPSLVIVDTLARCFDGDENLQEDMGRFIAGVDHIRRELNCTVLVVHHSRLDGTRERGNTSFRGAVDTMLSLTGSSALIEMSCVKQKDAEAFKDIQLELQTVPETESCIVVPSNALAERQQEMERVWFQLRQLEPCTWDTWKNATGLDSSRFAKSFRALQQAKRVAKGKDSAWRTTQPGEGSKP